MSTSVGTIAMRNACRGDIEALQMCDSAYSDVMEPWRAKDFKLCIRDEDMQCRIAEVGGMFAGYIVTEQYVNTIEIWRVCVDRMFLRLGLGSFMVHGIVEQLMLPRKGPYHKFRNIVADVGENNLRAQQFFRSLGFKARLPIVRDQDDSYYRFTYELFGDRRVG